MWGGRGGEKRKGKEREGERRREGEGERQSLGGCLFENKSLLAKIIYSRREAYTNNIRESKMGPEKCS